MYGEQVPRNHKEAMELDKKNENHRWAEAEALEINQLKEYETFQDIGPKGSTPRPAEHKRGYRYTSYTPLNMMAGIKREPWLGDI